MIDALRPFADALIWLAILPLWCGIAILVFAPCGSRVERTAALVALVGVLLATAAGALRL